MSPELRQLRRNDVIDALSAAARLLERFGEMTSPEEAARLVGLVPELRDVALRFERATNLLIHPETKR